MGSRCSPGDDELVRTVQQVLPADAMPGSFAPTAIVAKQGDHSLRYNTAEGGGDGAAKDRASLTAETREMNLEVARAVHRFLRSQLAAAGAVDI